MRRSLVAFGTAAAFVMSLGIADAAPKKTVHRRAPHSTRVTTPPAAAASAAKATSGTKSASAHPRTTRRNPKADPPTTAPTTAPSSAPAQHRTSTKPR